MEYDPRDAANGRKRACRAHAARSGGYGGAGGSDGLTACEARAAFFFSFSPSSQENEGAVVKPHKEATANSTPRFC